MLLNVAIGRHLELIHLETIAWRGCRGIIFKRFLDCYRSFSSWSSTHCAYKAVYASPEISPVYLATSIPRTDPWHRGSLQTTECIHVICLLKSVTGWSHPKCPPEMVPCQLLNWAQAKICASNCSNNQLNRWLSYTVPENVLALPSPVTQM